HRRKVPLWGTPERFVHRWGRYEGIPSKTVRPGGRTTPPRSALFEIRNVITKQLPGPRRVQKNERNRYFKRIYAGGRKRNRTAVRGFAVLCITTLPSGLSHLTSGI